MLLQGDECPASAKMHYSFTTHVCNICIKICSFKIFMNFLLKIWQDLNFNFIPSAPRNVQSFPIKSCTMHNLINVYVQNIHPKHNKRLCLEFKNKDQHVSVVWIPRRSRRRAPYGGSDHPGIPGLHRSRPFHRAALLLDGGSPYAVLPMDAPASSPLLVSAPPVQAKNKFWKHKLKFEFDIFINEATCM